MQRDDFKIFVSTLILAFLIVFTAPRCQVIYNKIIGKGNNWKAYGLIILSALMLFFALLKMAVIPYTEFIYFNF